MHPYLPQKVDIVEVEQPVAIVGHGGLSVREVDQPSHLLHKAGDIVINLLPRQHFTHVALARGVADHAGAAAEQGDRVMPVPLHMRHDDHGHKMPDMQAIGRRIKADVEGSSAAVQQLAHLLLIRRLRDQTALLQFIKKRHFYTSNMIRRFKPLPRRGQNTKPCGFSPVQIKADKKKTARLPRRTRSRGRKNPRYHLWFTAASRPTPHRVFKNPQSSITAAVPRSNLRRRRAPFSPTVPGCIRTKSPAAASQQNGRSLWVGRKRLLLPFNTLFF